MEFLSCSASKLYIFQYFFNLWYCQCRYSDKMFEFYDHMTVHRNRFLVNETNRCTKFQFHWYYNSTCFGWPICPSSGVLSRTSALVHFMRLWWPSATRGRMELVADGHHNHIKCTKAVVRLRTPDDGQKGCPKCAVIILIKLEFGASVGFIHKENVWIVTKCSHFRLPVTLAGK